jgi:hypothetical protein
VEDGVTTTEFYYLLLVIGAFAAFAVGMILATMQDKAWSRRESDRRAEAPKVPETRASVPTARAA